MIHRRVGFAIEVSNIKLPASIEDISRDWDTVEKPSTGPVWDFLWNAQVEEGREKYMLRHPFIINALDIPPTTDTSSETVHLAESVVKVSALFRAYVKHLVYMYFRWFLERQTKATILTLHRNYCIV